MTDRAHGETEPSRLPRFHPVVASYLGAWIDSDGCITQNKNRKVPFLIVHIGSTEVEHIATFLRLTHAGSVGLYPPSKTRYQPIEDQTPFWRWSLQRRAEVRDFIEQIKPYSIKAQKVSV
jgi:hypothetical protein